MRDISLEKIAEAIPTYTYLLHGDTRTGKTEFAATFPRPLILADVTERGYQTIAEMDHSKFFEPDVEPMIWGIENMNDMAQASTRMDPLIKAGQICTVVVDAFSFYCDLYLNFLFRMQAKADNRSAYGDLGKHLRDLRVKMHSKPCSVIWNALCKHPSSDDPKGRPMIPGQEADKFAAATTFLFHTRLEQHKEDGKVVAEEYQVRTRQYGAYIAGHRLGARAGDLPDPFEGSYSDLMRCLGHDPDAIRKSLSKRLPKAQLDALAKQVQPAVAAPPVVKTAGVSPTVIKVPAAKVTAASPTAVKTIAAVK